MANEREEFVGKAIVGGRGLTVRAIKNPVIDDVVLAEVRLEALRIMGGKVPSDHRVGREVRDFLIKVGVER